MQIGHSVRHTVPEVLLLARIHWKQSAAAFQHATYIILLCKRATMLSRNLGKQSVSRSTIPAEKPCVGRRRRNVVLVRAFQQSESNRPAAVQCIAPSSNTDTSEQAIITFGQVGRYFYAQ
jgi:hypothetical protein